MPPRGTTEDANRVAVLEDLLDEARFGRGVARLNASLREILGHARQGDYAARECGVLMAVAEARALGYEAGFRIDPAEPEWPVAFIQLPTGQVSWHMPQFPLEWDGHTTEEKNARIVSFFRFPEGV